MKEAKAPAQGINKWGTPDATTRLPGEEGEGPSLLAGVEFDRLD